MENYSSSSFQLDVDLSFTPFPVEDLDVFVKSETLELIQNPSRWIKEICSWIKFIQVNESLYLNSGVWNGPFQQERIKEFNGHLKVTKSSYESLDGESGKLIILS